MPNVDLVATLDHAWLNNSGQVSLAVRAHDQETYVVHFRTASELDPIEQQGYVASSTRLKRSRARKSRVNEYNRLII